MATDNTSEPAIVNQHFGAGLTLPSANGLPDMTGFDIDELGIPTNSWLSPSFILADRDLSAGEKLYTWLIRCSDGYPLEEIVFTVPKGSEAKTKWPQLFAKHVNGSARHLRAGGWNESGEFTDLPGSKTTSEFATLGLVEKSAVNRLWHYSRENRTFSTAPFQSNWVQTLLLSPLKLETNTTLCVQVRDITSQYLYETHFHTPKADRLESSQWTKDLCTQLNQDSKMLLAGTWDSKNAKITAADKDNALWIPQCSELAVTVQPLTWWTEQSIKAERDLMAGESISTYVWDEYSSAELIDSHTFTPSNAEECKKQNWMGAWAKLLNTSTLASYVRLGTRTDKSTELAKDATEATLWQAGAGLRVFTTEPSATNWITFSTPLEQMYKDTFSSVEIRIIDDFSQRIFYRYLSRTHSAVVLADAMTWWKTTAQVARADFKKDGKSFIQIPDDNIMSLRVPKMSRLKIEFKSSPPIPTEEVEAWTIIETLKSYKKAQDESKGERVTFLEQKENMSKVYSEFTQKKLDIYTGINPSDLSSSVNLSGYVTYLEMADKIERALNPNREPDQPFDRWSIEPSIFTSDLSNEEALMRAKSLIKDNNQTQQESSVVSQQDSMTLQMNKFSAAFELLNQHFNGDDQKDTLAARQKLLSRLDSLSFGKDLFQKVSYLDIFRLVTKNDADTTTTFLENTIRNEEIIVFERKLDILIKTLTLPPNIYINFRDKTKKYYSTNPYEAIYSNDNSGSFTIRLTPLTRSRGARLIPSFVDPNFTNSTAFNVHFPEGGKPDSGPSAYTGFTHSGTIWEKFETLSLNASIPDAMPTPDSALCEDYGNTFRSEVFDTSGQNTTGVDPRTGLFNAHYSIATLTDREGKGPVIDLTLRYSPLRANEAGLGDGWAFNFSWYDSRQKLLTLSTGQTVQFTNTEMAALKSGKIVERPICQITATFSGGEKKYLLSLSICFPSGRKEVLAANDGYSEHNAEFVTEVIRRLKEAKTQIPLFIESTRPVLNLKWYHDAIQAFLDMFGKGDEFIQARITYDRQLEQWKEYWAQRLPELNTQIHRELDYWETPDQQLLPESITSHLGGQFDFKWENKQGQHRLKKISTVYLTLLTCDYEDGSASEKPDIKSSVTLNLWPGTTESTVVELKLKNYLLDSVSLSSSQDNIVVQRVQYGYSPDPTLDRVLTCIEESDGSLEKVFYENEGMQFPSGTGWKPPLPRVRTHVISPGADQPVLRTDWHYSEQNFLGYTKTGEYNRFEDTAVYQGASYIYSSTETEYQGTSIKRSWNGFHLQVEEQQISLDGASKTTQWKFSDAKQGAPLFGSPIEIVTTYQKA